MKYQLLLAATLVCSVLHAQTQMHERWDVKTLTDGFSPDMHSVDSVSVAVIEPQARVHVGNNQPRMDFEKQVIRISGTITRIQLEKDDNDYHIEVSDGSLGDSALVCEAVDPENTITVTSPYKDDFRTVRELAATLKKGDKVTFTGVVFQDKYHNPSPHRTRNFIEMHPILMAEKK